MLLFIYQISIYLYAIAIQLAAPFNPKAKQWVNGRKNIFIQLKKNIAASDQIYWFHCASLGEFEQGKPIIDAIKNKHSNIKILVTFFSPSGFEMRKNYKNADYIFYLPLDTKKNAQKFIQIIQPKKVFFIKYEFWYNYLFELNKNKIPTYLISGVFRKEQLFFKSYGALYKKMLPFFTCFFVQNETSKVLLKSIGFNNTITTGDTRIDRVYENSLTPKNVPLIKSFKGNKPLFILGSSWQKEEEIISEFISATKKNYKYIIAPHDISSAHIKKIETLLKSDFIKYSEANSENIKNVKTLIIDNIGLLSNIYQYTDIAFIGGGFSGSLHNILEPASFGNALLFGPKHVKFHEAEELIRQKAAYEIKDIDDLLAILNHLETDGQLNTTQLAASSYIKNGVGATTLILNELNL
jgi:3-deoxy-D-manno-octulosonic-acid transferase